MTELSELTEHEWDAIVIGTGMGGATIGYALAKAGRRVLFCERGQSYLSNPQALRGDYAESSFPRPEAPAPDHHNILRRAGRWSGEIEDQSARRAYSYIPFIGCGTGGSSALYGMALERLFPADFQPRRCFPDADGSTLPDSWPIGYQELSPYYGAAERLYRVRGSIDPLSEDPADHALLTPPPLSPPNQELHGFLSDKGLHPYRLPSACEYVPGCQGCQGYLCPKDCKNDSARICLEPAINRYGARLLDRCQVLRLEAKGGKVTSVTCAIEDQKLKLRGKTVILAAGALQTPTLLLRSVSPEWPQGLANESGLVGRNLMRHCIDLYAVFTKTKPQAGSNQKEIAFNDLYSSSLGNKLGSVQSFGSLPPVPVLLASMEQDLRNSPMALLAGAFGLAKPLLKPVLSRIFSSSMILAGILEDLPYSDNRIMLSDQQDPKPLLQYRIHDHERQRIEAFRQDMQKILKPYRFLLLKQAENNERIAHVCGTCRFGIDPQDSVLNPDNRAHGVENLYVVDGSFFPSSGGTNPALTIAANALRVADILTGASASTS